MSFRIRNIGLILLALFTFETAAAGKTADKCWMGPDRDHMVLKFYESVEGAKEIDTRVSYNVNFDDSMINVEFERAAAFYGGVLNPKIPRQMIINIYAAVNGKLAKKSSTTFALPRGGYITLYDLSGMPLYVQCGTYPEGGL